MKKKIGKNSKELNTKKMEKAVKNVENKSKSVMSVEVLSHFRCEDCKGWWSIGDAILHDKTDWFCPWCGVKNIFEKFKNQ